MLAPTLPESILRLAIAVVLAATLGWERTRALKPVGARTMVLTAVGAAAFVLLGQHQFAAAGEAGIHSDPTRVLSYIIVGVGFLGGGAILHSRRHIRGLTTAAAIWVGAAVGSAAGLGQLALAGIVTLIAFLTLETIPHRMQRRRFSTLPDVPMRPQ